MDVGGDGDGVRRAEPAREGELEAILAEPRMRRWPVGIASLAGLLLLAAGIAWTLGFRGGVRSAQYDSIAVLPFANLIGVAADEYFGDGRAEELLNALGVAGLSAHDPGKRPSQTTLVDILQKRRRPACEPGAGAGRAARGVSRVRYRSGRWPAARTGSSSA